MAIKFKAKTKDEIPAELQPLYSGGDKAKLDEFRTNNIALSNQLAETKRRFEGIGAGSPG